MSRDGRLPRVVEPSSTAPTNPHCWPGGYPPCMPSATWFSHSVLPRSVLTKRSNPDASIPAASRTTNGWTVGGVTGGVDVEDDEGLVVEDEPLPLQQPNSSANARNVTACFMVRSIRKLWMTDGLPQNPRFTDAKTTWYCWPSVENLCNSYRPETSHVIPPR